MDAELKLEMKALLGEGAIWNSLRNELYWVDIEGKSFHVFDPVSSEIRAFDTYKKIGTVVPVDDEHVLVALEDGIATVNIKDGTIIYRLATGIHHEHNRRFNDGKCDPSGRFWVGTLSMSGAKEVSSLYAIDGDLGFEEKLTGVSISNGIAWSADGKLMYYIDTPTSQVVQFDFKCDSGHISNRKVIIQVPDDMGFPDGMTIDCDGNLWVALWDGFGVAKYNPANGELLQKINVPAPKVTSCAFGGEDLDILFITTARVEMSDEELEQYPLSGSIFTARVGTKGVPANRFEFFK
jgi:sugar lactone lactonase YvrE